MRVPGFTAEACMYKTSTSYRSATYGAFANGVPGVAGLARGVTPAQARRPPWAWHDYARCILVGSDILQDVPFCDCVHLQGKDPKECLKAWWPPLSLVLG